MNQYMPSHADSSVNEIARMYQGNPGALAQRVQPQNGITPELVDMLAMQKLQADKKAAATQMALNAGQQPTVAQGMRDEAMKSAREEITQKMGLPGLMQAQQGPQGANPAQAGQAQPQAPQGAGLQAAASNLPKQYAGGGIVSFDEGGATTPKMMDPDFDADGNPRSKSEREYILANNARMQNAAQRPHERNAELSMSPWQAKNAPETAAYAQNMPSRMAEYNKPRIGLNRPEVSPSQAADSSQVAASGKSGFDLNQPGGLAQLAANIQDIKDPRDRAAAQAQLEKQIVQQGGDSAPQPMGLAGAARPSQVTAQQTAPATGTSTPSSDFTQAVQNAVRPGLQTVPIAETREAARKEYQAGTGAANQAAIDAQAKRAEGLQGLYDKQAANRPSDLMVALQRMGQNVHGVGLGGAFAGVGEAVDKAHTTQDAQAVANMESINKLMDARDKAIRENNIGLATALDTAVKEKQAEQGKAITAGTSLVNAEVTATGHKIAAADAAAARAAIEKARIEGKDESKALAILEGHKSNALKMAMAAATKQIAGNPMADLPSYKGPTVEELASSMYPKLLANLTGETPTATMDIPADRANKFKVIRGNS